MAMTQVEQAEPPSWFRPPVFMIGQDRGGNWVVRDQDGIRGGLFIIRDAAFRFVRSENGYRPQAVVVVSGDFELDMSRNAGKLSHGDVAAAPADRRRIA
jgi:hypothetical protein